MPPSAHTTTSTNRAMVPRNFRVRIGMTETCGSGGARLARGVCGTISGARIHSSHSSMTTGSQSRASLRAVRWWLIAVAALISLMVLVGGATRLTESGLSIVEWKPITGTLPPLGEQQWIEAFEAYKTIPQ